MDRTELFSTQLGGEGDHRLCKQVRPRQAIVSDGTLSARKKEL